jgi:DNA invertase Pin-like site-specific DNA recombinase
MFQMMGVFAEFERAMIQERVRAGLARARGEGKRLGRPPIAPALEKRIREALATPGRPGVRVIAKQFGVNPGTVQRISRPAAGGGGGGFGGLGGGGFGGLGGNMGHPFPVMTAPAA